MNEGPLIPKLSKDSLVQRPAFLGVIPNTSFESSCIKLLDTQKMPESLAAVLCVMCQKEVPHFLEFLKSSGLITKQSCSVIWNRGDWLYHCLDCQADPQCALCVECFEESLHKGHKYSISRAGGGCCDCGDENAWNPDTFCSKHRKREVSEAEKKVFASDPFVMGFSCLGNKFKALLSEPEFPNALAIGNLIQMYSLLPEIFGDGIVHPITESLVKSGALDRYCAVDHQLPSSLQTLGHQMIFSLLISLEFKTEFGKSFSRCYGDTLKLEAPRKNTLLEFTVQVFTNPVIAPILVKEEKLLSQLLDFANDKMRNTTCVDNLTSKTILDGNGGVFTRGRLLQCVNDLRYLLTHDDIVLNVVKDKNLWDGGLVRLLENLQGCFWLRRKLGEHVAFEKQGYRSVIGFEQIVWEHLINIEDALFGSNEQRVSLEDFRSACQAVWKVLSSWMSAHPLVGACYDDTKDSFTLALSLHRMLSLLLRAACVGHGYAVCDVAPFLADNALAISSHVWRALRFESTLDAGMWRRNGETAVVLGWFYLSASCWENTVDRDVFLLRCCVNAAPDVSLFLQNSVTQEFNGGSDSIMAESFMRWLIVLVTENETCSRGREGQRLKRDILNLLAAAGGSTTHSKLEEMLPQRTTEHAKFEDWLKEVSDFVGSNFTLKRGLWKEVNPYFSHFSPEQRQAAEEYCATEYRKATKSANDAPFSGAPVACSKEAFGSEGIWKLLSCDKLHIFCSKILSVAAQSEDEEKSKGFVKAAHRAADLLFVCASHLPHDHPFFLWIDKEVLTMLFQWSEKCSAYLKTALTRLLMQLKQCPSLSARFEGSSIKDAVKEESDADRRARLRAEAKERQRQIMEKMKKNREQFASQNKEELDAAVTDETQLDRQCVLCRDTKNSQDDPMCHLVLAQSFPVMAETTVVSEVQQETEKKKQKMQRGQEDPNDVAAVQPKDSDTLEELMSKSRNRMVMSMKSCNPPELLIRACTHCLHMSCYQQHFAALCAKRGQEVRDMGISLENGEFFCPLCQAVSNAVLPVTEQVKFTKEDFAPSVSLDQWISDTSAWFASSLDCEQQTLRLSLLHSRVGTLLWGYPPPTNSPALLMDAPVSAVLADEITNDEGARDALLKPVLEGCQAMCRALDMGDVEVGQHLWKELLSNPCALDPLLTFCRIILSLPLKKRAQSVFHLFLMAASVCVMKKQDVNVLRSRVLVLLDCIGLVEEEDGKLCVLPELEQIKAKAEQMSKTFSVPEKNRSVFGDGRLHFSFVTLPQVLQEKQWFKNAVEFVCEKCQSTPTHVALCLLCGVFCCKNGDCCRVASVGECSQHAENHHQGCGLFLDVKESSVLILRRGGGAIWKSPYLDDYGEQDIGLRRGRPITLHPPILEELKRRYVCCALIDVTVNTGKRLLLASWRSF